MTERIAQASQWPNARITGGVYLLYFLTAISAVALVRGIVVSGDAAATAYNILAHEPLYRSGFAVGLIGTALYIVVTVLLYGLLKPVNGSLALLAAFFSLAGCAVQASGELFQVGPLVVLGGGHYLSAFGVEQLRALALMFLNLYAQTGYISLVFFGVFDFAIGYLILKSTFLPRILGVPMALAGLGWLTFVSPPLASHLSPYVYVLGFIAEALLMLWLLVMGVNVERWKAQTAEGK